MVKIYLDTYSLLILLTYSFNIFFFCDEKYKGKDEWSNR